MRPNSSAGSLPRRFRQLRLLVIGCGDVGLRLCGQLDPRIICTGIVRTGQRAQRVRGAGARPLVFDLDAPDNRRRPEAVATHIVYLVPPDPQRSGDPRLAASLARVRRRHNMAGQPARRLAYTSTTGVFGDAGGQRLTETSTVRPASDRAMRRLAAERLVRAASRPVQHHRLGLVARHPAVTGSIYRAPGIYAEDRLPRKRLEQQLPCLQPDQDGYSNRIHAADLARILWLGLFRGGATRVYIASDGQEIRMGDYFDQVADALGLPRPPRLSAQAVREQVSPMAWSFLKESRRLSNARLTRELRIRLRYPGLATTLASLKDPEAGPNEYKQPPG